MNSDQFGGVLRSVLAFLAGWVPTTFMTPDITSGVIGGVVTTAVAVWSWYTNKSGTVVK